MSSSSENFVSFHEFFQLTEVTWSQDNASDHNAGFELLRHPPYSPFVLYCTANGWLEDREQQFFYNGIRALEKCWTKCISFAGVYFEK